MNEQPKDYATVRIEKTDDKEESKAEEIDE
jgi:hypothetical protein